ncbi:MAG: ATP-binding protein [Syntrophomonadaceae bacterium]|nr:ATP-binding protein [Syntrophomonadaceae bacterium]
MLLEFKANNYKSFRDELIFSMIPAPKQKGLDYSILKKKIGRREYKGLSAAVIYGANASGKSNIISAMDTFKAIILRGNIKNDEGKTDPNAAASVLELIPNNSNNEPQPVSFGIKFIIDELLVEYTISLEMGCFLDTEYTRRILSECLKVNEKEIFSRSDKLNMGKLDVIKEYLVNALAENVGFNSANSLAQSSLNDKELFLMNGFKTMFSSKLVSVISEWFENKFIVVYRTDAVSTIRKFTDMHKNFIYVEKTLNEAAKQFGVNSNAVGYIVEGNEGKARLYSLFDSGGKKESKGVPAKLFESYGTIRFINIFPLIAKALLTGGTLVADEFDASIHPMALMSIVNVFHNDDINIHRAQLVFNTHNPIFLNSNLFRRDEIKFVERDDETHISTHYSLADFGTVSKNSARKEGDYMKNYFVDRYGAIRDIDLAPVFESLISGGKDG